MSLALVVAAAENGVIGRDNGLPWRLPGDLKQFRRLTTGKPVIMGRRTFESIGRALPERLNIVVSRQPGYREPGILVVPTFEEAVRAGREAAAPGMVEVMVIGGADIYRQALPLADRIYLTEVHARVDGDTHLPAVDWTEWREVSRELHPAGPGHSHDYSFVVLDRAEM